jgi:hypothetical protein
MESAMRKTMFLALLCVSFMLFGFTKEEAVKALKEKGIEISDQSLRNAYNNKDIALMDLLVDAGVNVNLVNAKDTRFFENMIIASGENIPQKEQCKQLALKMLEKGASPNPTKVGEYSPLMYAAMSGAYEIADILITKGADINYKAADESTALLGAIVTQDVQMVIYLLQVGAKKTGTKSLSFKELVNKTGNEELIKLLIPKSNNFMGKIGDTFLLAGIIGFLFNGFDGILHGFAFVLLLPIFGIMFIMFVLGVIAAIFEGATDAMMNSKIFNFFGLFEKMVSIIPAVRKTLKDEEAFKAKMEAKYAKKQMNKKNN